MSDAATTTLDPTVAADLAALQLHLDHRYRFDMTNGHHRFGILRAVELDDCGVPVVLHAHVYNAEDDADTLLYTMSWPLAGYHEVALEPFKRRREPLPRARDPRDR